VTICPACVKKYRGWMGEDAPLKNNVGLLLNFNVFRMFSMQDDDASAKVLYRK